MVVRIKFATVLSKTELGFLVSPVCGGTSNTGKQSEIDTDYHEEKDATLRNSLFGSSRPK